MKEKSKEYLRQKTNLNVTKGRLLYKTLGTILRYTREELRRIALTTRKLMTMYQKIA